MLWPTVLIALSLFTTGTALTVYAPADDVPQIALATPESQVPAWDQPLDKDATGNLILQSLYSLMQIMPNSRYQNGHSVVRAHIPPGTLLYHGSILGTLPAMDWLALDPEHSQLFTQTGKGKLLSYVTTRQLHLVYFDGASANKFGSVVDTQNVLIYGDIHHKDNISDPLDFRAVMAAEMKRIAEACAWGKPYGIDGFVRIQYDFEIMYCDFSNGLELVSELDAVPFVGGGPGWAGGLPRILFSIDPAPQGWRGSLAGGSFQMNESAHVSTWHDYFPGDLRIRLDPSTMMTFFDPAFASLIPSRRELPRAEYSLSNISQQDVERAQAIFAEIWARPAHSGSGMDWVGLVQTVTQRFATRLPLLRYLLHQPSVFANASAQVAEVRKHLSVSLLPYMSRMDVGTSAWFGQTAKNCANSFTKYVHLYEERLTEQEHVLRNAVDEVLHEICRVLGQAWEEAFDVEEQSTLVAQEKMERWRRSISELVEWLDWPIWNVCRPGCSIDEVCWLPQKGPFGGDKQESTPHCVSLNTAGA